MFRSVIFLSVVVFLKGCVTSSVRMENVDMPLAQIQQAVDTSLPLSRKRVSPNGREFLSEHFVPTGKKIRPVKPGDRLRFYAHVLVLGDRRPYQIEIHVYREEKAGAGAGEDGFAPAGSDESLARTLAKRISAALAKRQGNRDVIDDFRVF